MRATKPTSLSILLALGLTAGAGAEDARRIVLHRSTLHTGETVAVDQRSTIELGSPEGSTRAHLESRSAYRVTIVGKNEATLTARFDIEAGKTTVERDGQIQETSEAARTVIADVKPQDLAFAPAPGSQAAGAATREDFLAKKDAVSVGESWTAERALPIAGGALEVAVKATYTVAGIDRDPHGHELLRVELRTRGSAALPQAAGVLLTVTGEGTALVDPDHADRPAEVRLAYRFTTSGGEGEDAETRTETTIHTRSLGADETQAPVASKEKAQ